MFQLIAQSSGGSAAGLLIPFLLLGGLFYFMILRPQQRRQRAQQELINTISEGDEITHVYRIETGAIMLFRVLADGRRQVKGFAYRNSMNVLGMRDEIITTAGIFGVVMSIDDEEGTVTVAIAPGTEIKLLRAGIGRRVTVDEDYADYEDDDEDQDEQQGDEQDVGDEDTSDGPEQPGQIKEL